MNVEPGFWNPISNSFYLARNGGANYASAWTSALGVRANADHLYIDSWNETGEGSGIFDAPPLTYTASTDGPCQAKPWTYKHDDSWGPSPRHFIDQTRTNADQWNDVPDLDAEIVADDFPATMKAGERRWVSVVVRNRGDKTWSAPTIPVLRSRGGDFTVSDVPMTPETGPRIRGYPVRDRRPLRHGRPPCRGRPGERNGALRRRPRQDHHNLEAVEPRPRAPPQPPA